MKISVIIPTLNGGTLFKQCAESINNQNSNISEVIIVDSGSTDDTLVTAINAGFTLFHIEKSTFDHGGTRTYAAGLASGDILIFMTQDAILNTASTIEKLVDVFSDQDVSCAFARQIPHSDANVLATHARLENYPNESYVTSLHSDNPAGFRKAYMSNSCAAYRRTYLEEFGFFEKNLVLGEDFNFAAKSLISGKKVAYVSESTVRHSHNYTISEEFQRYFDIGVSHSDSAWILDRLGPPTKQGYDFAMSQVRFCLDRNLYTLAVKSIITTFAKFLAYKLGRIYNFLPRFLVIRLGMHKAHYRRIYSSPKV